MIRQGATLARVWNGQVAARADIPRLPPERFREQVAGLVDAGWRLVSLFGHPTEAVKPAWRRVALTAVLAEPDGARLGLCETEVGPEFLSLTPVCVQASRFEREIAEQLGVRPVGHPWLKALRSHAPWDAAPALLHLPELDIGVDYPFFRMQGEEVHEVAVGPVHAGIIEPGHFRFQCHGEEVYHLEIMLGYQHRGLERALLGGPGRRSLHQLEELAGDSTVAHTLAYCQALEALGSCSVPPRAQALRAVALELERVANHTGDIGALAGDVAFLPTASYCGRLRGTFLNLTARMCGNRFGRGLLRPGGVRYDLTGDEPMLLRAELERMRPELESAVDLFFSTPTVLDRVEGIGALDAETAETLGLVGPPARACGLSRDVRHDHSAGMYRLVHIPMALAGDGDVHARANVRWLEIQRSLEFVREVLTQLPAGEIRAECAPPRPDAAVVSLVEGWRGEVAHVALTDAEGRLARYKVTDPSFHNWPGLELAMRGQQISDFPLCNKSFNLSYSGHDL